MKVGPVIAARVKRLTKRPEQPYADYIEELVLHADLIELIVKYCDIMHNLSTLPMVKSGMHKRYHKSLVDIYGAIVQRMKAQHYIFS